MKTIIFPLILLILSNYALFSEPKFCIHEEKSPCIFLRASPSMGRFGDYLATYIKAKWLAYINNISLIIHPSESFEGLIMSQTETFSTVPPQGRKVCLRDFSDFFSNGRVTYIVDFNPILFESPELLNKIKKDQKFCKEIREKISPIGEIELIHPPKDIFSVAVHIRNGGGYDLPLLSEQIFAPDSKRKRLLSKNGLFKNEFGDSEWPTKFFPEQFFIDQIKELSKKLNHRPLYVFIFTDNLNPEELRKRIENNVNLPNIIFDSRKIYSNDRKQLLTDFFSMPNFDCLIRPISSHFSLLTEFLADYKIVIYPKNFYWEVDKENKYYLVADGVLTKVAKGFEDLFHVIVD